MNSRLGPALAELSEGRWTDERVMDLRTTDLRAMEPPLHPSELERLKSEHRSTSRRIPASFARFAIVFCVGVAATLAWQSSYGNAARRVVASLSPRLGWLTPAAVPAEPSSSAPAASVSPDQLVAISRSLAVVRQSVDRLAVDITKLQATKQDLPPARTSAAPPAGRKPASTAQAPSVR